MRTLAVRTGLCLALAVAAGCSSARPQEPAARLEPLRASVYYAALESDYPAGEEAAFRDAAGRVLHRASAEYVRKASIEGAAHLADGRTLMFDPAEPGKGWRWSSARLGVDAQDCPLVPFHSAAVARSIPLGAVLFIPETVGLPLPGGGRHDGVWYATDRGIGIEGDRIDLFAGLGKKSMDAVESYGLDYLAPVHARIIGRLHACPGQPHGRVQRGQ